MCVLLLHYQPPCKESVEEEEEETETRDTNTLMGIRDELDGVWTKLFNLRARTTPTRMTHRIANRLVTQYIHTRYQNIFNCLNIFVPTLNIFRLIAGYLLVVTGTAVITAQYLDLVERLETVVIVPLAGLLFLIFLLLFCLALQPRNKESRVHQF